MPANICISYYTLFFNTLAVTVWCISLSAQCMSSIQLVIRLANVLLCYVWLEGGTEERENSGRNKEKVSLKKKLLLWGFFLHLRCI